VLKLYLTFALSCLAYLCLFVDALCGAQDIPANAQVLELVDAQDCSVFRAGKELYLKPSKLIDNGQLSIPRFAASLRRMQWLGSAGSEDLQLKPEPNHWIITWKVLPPGASLVVLEFDTPPRLLSELPPAQPSGDGSFYLPGYLAQTAGTKIRYEPQTFKNTVGYWTGPNDSATWLFELTEPGTFNVAILQGCGAGQGGSQAKLTIALSNQSTSQAIDFEVLETGHFQNFQWRTLGSVELTSTGTHKLTVQPIAIKKAALMDIRALHLIRIPTK
jgi:hypothetical protein